MPSEETVFVGWFGGTCRPRIHGADGLASGTGALEDEGEGARPV